MAEPRIQYVKTSDETNIAYTEFGNGPNLLYLSDLPNAHLRLEWQQPLHQAYLKDASKRFHVIRYDPRGHGMSDREIEGFSLEKRLLDMEAVVDELALESVDVLAPSRAGPLAVLYAVRHPDRVSRLILWNTFGAASEQQDSPRRHVDELLDRDYDLFTESVAGYALGWGGAATDYAAFMRACTTHEAAKVIYRAMDEDDVTPILNGIKAPTLILQSDGLRDRPVAMGRNLAARIPNARLVVLSGTWSDSIDEAFAAIEEFLIGDVEPATYGSAGGLRTVLFTDIVGHTEMMQRLGDTRGRDVLREHERITRETLKAHGGAEVKTMGDGFMASFGSVTKAMDCAIALQRAFAAHSASDTGAGPVEALNVRVGLNAGEPIEEDGDLFGSTVILASRIAAQAGAGEILIPEPLRHLLSGKSYVYADRGEVALKGFEDAVRLFEVRWRE